MRHRYRNAARFFSVILLLVFCAAIVVGFSAIVPIGAKQTEAKNKVSGLQGSGNNATQVIAVGTSVIYRGFSPVRLFEEHGITSYNCGGSHQSSTSAYYLLAQALRSCNGVEVALVDVNMFQSDRTKSAELSSSQATLMYMPFPLKVDMTAELADDLGLSLAEMWIPGVRLHSQWPNLTSADFKRPFTSANTVISHGQALSSSCESNVTRNRAGKYGSTKNETITDSNDTGKTADQIAEEMERNADLARIVRLCNSSNVKVVLVKMPDSGWGDAEHDWACALAQEHGVSFVDFCAPAVWGECNLSYDTDCLDDVHPNLLGSLKVTDYLGRFLVDQYDMRGCRQDPSSGFSEEDLSAFNEWVEDARLCQCTNLNEYASLLERDRYDVYAAVRGEAADQLDGARESLAELGFKGLASLGEGASYVGIVEAGKLKAERTDRRSGKVELVGGFCRMCG